MSQSIYQIFSDFLGLTKEHTDELYNMEPSQYVEQYQIPLEAASVIAHVCKDRLLSEPRVIAGLFTIANMKLASPDFWQKFRATSTYIFVEFAKHNFFPITYDVDVNELRQKFETVIGDSRQYENVYEFTSPKVITKARYLDYIAFRSRGTPTRLANLVVAADIIPDGLFDWNSCLRGEEREQLMILGIQELDPEVFNEWVELYEKFGDY